MPPKALSAKLASTKGKCLSISDASKRMAVRMNVSESFYDEKVKLFWLADLKKCGMENNDYECMKFCMDVGLISDKYECPVCKKCMQLKCVRGAWMWRCRSEVQGCVHDIKRAVKRGLWFDHSNLSFSNILLVTYFFSYKMSI